MYVQTIPTAKNEKPKYDEGINYEKKVRVQPKDCSQISNNYCRVKVFILKVRMLEKGTTLLRQILRNSEQSYITFAGNV